MRIALVVPGRFHAFDLSRALIARGNDVVILTNYPAWAVGRFGIPAERVRSFVLHGVLSRIAQWIGSRTGWSPDSWLHPMFSRWARRILLREHFDIIHAWTGVAENIYSDSSFAGTLKLIMRGSAHIRTQARLLAEETLRAGHEIDHPSAWSISREQREYGLADSIILLSTFAFNSFVEEGCPAERLRFLPLGTNVKAFRPTAGAAEARRSRILAGSRLRVLYVGGISWRKGFADLRSVIEMSGDRFDFRFVGPVWSEVAAEAASLRNVAEFIDKKPQSELPAEYAWGDVFVFPTIEDGYAVVIAQASAAGLPILTTPNCCGPDLILEGRTGFILPIRDPRAFVGKLDWLDANRAEFARMADTCYSGFRPRDWNDVAADFEAMCAASRKSHRASHAVTSV